MAMTAIVLAGGPPDDVAAKEPGAPNKAFVRIAGVALVERVIAALQAAPSIGRIVVVAPEASHEHAALANAHERRADGTRITQRIRGRGCATEPFAAAA